MNRKGEISLDKQVRVLAAAQRLGYAPSAVAQALVSGRTRTLGVVTTDNASPVYAEALRGIQDVATPAGFGLLFCNSADRQEQALQCLAMLQSKHVDGVLLAPVQTDHRDIEYLERSGRPFVFLLRYFPELPHIDYVITDNVAGGLLMTNHLLDLGHRVIGHIGGPAYTSTAQGRLAGYRHALERRGIPYAPDLVVHAPYTVAGGCEAAHALLSRPDRPSAIFAATDLQAVGVLKAAKQLALCIPTDLALAGGDDIELAEFLEVPLTTFHQSTRRIGALAAEILLSKLSGKAQAAQQIALTPTLVVRKSSGCPR
jgi:LacI family transcriptional regulator